MQQLTPQGQQAIQDLAQRYGVSADAVMTLLRALVNGNGTMAQFSHPELGGAGQWMQGGMTMVGDIFNYSLQSKVDGLCTELANLLARQPGVIAATGGQFQAQGGQQQQQSSGYGQGTSLFIAAAQGGGGNWWPAELGMPGATGSQNAVRYAYFPQARRLAVDLNGQVTVYDTLDHQIGGVSQQQGGDGLSVTFTSQHGTVSLAELPVVSGAGLARKPATPTALAGSLGSSSSDQTPDVFATLERLAELKQKGILSEEEFNAKKAELLSRL